MKFEKSILTPDTLRAIQTEAGLDNVQIANMLGISEKTWMNRISKTGGTGSLRKLEYEFLLLLIGRHPEYTLSVKS